VPGIDELETLSRANLGFYEAFQTLDPEKMDAVWAETEDVTAVHPGWALIKGRSAVMESWRRIFENPSMMQFAVTGVELRVEGNVGWVTCTENITSLVDGQVGESRVQGTNVYVRRGTEWRMVHHHGSPVMRR